MSHITKISSCDLRYGVLKTFKSNTYISSIKHQRSSASSNINSRQFSTGIDNEENVVIAKSKAQASREKRHELKEDLLESKVLRDALDKEFDQSAYSKFYGNDPDRLKPLPLSKSIPQLTSTMDVLVNAFPDHEDDPSTYTNSTDYDQLYSNADKLNNQDSTTSEDTIRFAEDDITDSSAFQVTGSDPLYTDTNVPEVNLNNLAFEFTPPNPIIVHPEVGKLSKDKQVEFVKAVSFISQIFSNLDDYLVYYSNQFTKNELSYFENAMRILRTEYFNNDNFRATFKNSDKQPEFKLTLEESKQANKDVESILVGLVQELEKFKIDQSDDMQVLREFNEDLNDYLPVMEEDEVNRKVVKKFSIASDLDSFTKMKGITTTFFAHLKNIKSFSERNALYMEFVNYKKMKDQERSLPLGPTSLTLNSIIVKFRDFTTSETEVQQKLQEFGELGSRLRLDTEKIQILMDAYRESILPSSRLEQEKELNQEVEVKEEVGEEEEEEEEEEVSQTTKSSSSSSSSLSLSTKEEKVSVNRVLKEEEDQEEYETDDSFVVDPSDLAHFRGFVDLLLENGIDYAALEVQIDLLVNEMAYITKQYLKKVERETTLPGGATDPDSADALPKMFKLKEEITQLLKDQVSDIKDFKEAMEGKDEEFISQIKEQMEEMFPDDATSKEKLEFILSHFNSGIDFDIVNSILNQQEPSQSSPPQPIKNINSYQPVQLIKALYKLGPGKFKNTVENLKRLPNLVYYCQYINDAYLNPDETYIAPVAGVAKKVEFPSFDFPRPKSIEEMEEESDDLEEEILHNEIPPIIIPTLLGEVAIPDGMLGKNMFIDERGRVTGKNGELVGIINSKGKIVAAINENDKLATKEGDTIQNNGAIVDRYGNIIGLTDREGNVLGMVNEEGNLVNDYDEVIGMINKKDGSLIDKDGEVLAEVEKEEGDTIIQEVSEDEDADDIVCVINEDGEILNKKGRVIGMVDENGQIIGRVNKKGNMVDQDGNMVDENNNIVDKNGTVIGRIDENGDVVLDEPLEEPSEIEKYQVEEEENYVVDEDDYLVGIADQYGNLVKTFDENGKLVNERGEVVYSDGSIYKDGKLNGVIFMDYDDEEEVSILVDEDHSENVSKDQDLVEKDNTQDNSVEESSDWPLGTTESSQDHTTTLTQDDTTELTQDDTTELTQDDNVELGQEDNVEVGQEDNVEFDEEDQDDDVVPKIMVFRVNQDGEFVSDGMVLERADSRFKRFLMNEEENRLRMHRLIEKQSSPINPVANGDIEEANEATSVLDQEQQKKEQLREKEIDFEQDKDQELELELEEDITEDPLERVLEEREERVKQFKIQKYSRKLAANGINYQEKLKEKIAQYIKKREEAAEMEDQSQQPTLDTTTDSFKYPEDFERKTTRDYMDIKEEISYDLIERKHYKDIVLEDTITKIKFMFPFFGVGEEEDRALGVHEKIMSLEVQSLLFKGNFLKNPEESVFVGEDEADDTYDIAKKLGYDRGEITDPSGTLDHNEGEEDNGKADESEESEEEGLEDDAEEEEEEEEDKEDQENLYRDDDNENLDGAFGEGEDYINYKKGLRNIQWSDTPKLNIKNLVAVGRHTSVTRAGRVYNFSATVFNGDGEGTASRGYGKGDTAVAALKRATKDAQRKAFTLDRFRGLSLPSGLDIKYRSTKIRFYKSKNYDEMDFSGMKQTVILPTIGLHGVTFRTFGRRNWNNVLLAIQNGLPHYTNPEEAARVMGKRFVVPNEENEKNKTLSQLLKSKLKKKNSDPYNLGMVNRFLYDLEEKPDPQEMQERRMNAELRDLMERYPQDEEEEMQEKDFKYNNLTGKKRVDKMHEKGRRHERNIKLNSVY